MTLMLQLAKRDNPGSVEQSIYRHPKATRHQRRLGLGAKIRFVLELMMKDFFLHFVLAEGGRRLQRKSVCGHLSAFSMISLNCILQTKKDNSFPRNS